MQLVDRDVPLGLLRASLEQAASGRGRIALVAGEAGIGKTALLRAFLGEVAPEATVLVGACDDLLTPAPLGPFREIGRGIGGPLQAVLDGPTASYQVHDALLEALAGLPPPVVVALEDLHWADGATLDAVTVVARWLVDRRVLLVATYRDDEVGPGHPLARVLARLPATATTVVAPTALDVSGVGRLVAAAGNPLDPAELHRSTGGNPFYVTEVLAGDGLGHPPPSIAFAVRARLARLPAPTRELLELVSLIPGRVPVDLLDVLEPDWAGVLEPAEQVGVLEARQDAVAFRHELARRALADTLTGLRSRTLHARILDAIGDDADLTTLVHHAEGAGDVERTVREASRAAAAAAAAESYPEAMAHHERALSRPELLTTAEQFEQWYGLARARLVSGAFEGLVQAAERAVALARDLDDPVRLGQALASHARIASMVGNTSPTALVEEALAVTEPLGASRARAEAVTAQAYVCLADWDFEAAQEAAAAGHEIARAAGARDLAAMAAMLAAVVAISVDADLEPLRRAERHAREADARWAVVEGSMAACTALLFRRMYDDALDVAERMLDFAGVHDFSEGWGAYVHAVHAQALIDTGRWDEAATELDRAVATLPVIGWPLLALRSTRGRLRARRGEADGAAEDLAVAESAASDAVSFQPRFTLATACAEAAWLRGDVEPPASLLALHDHPHRTRSRPAQSAIALWLARTGGDPGPIEETVGPFRALLEERPLDAAVAWDAFGCVYEAAEARVLSDDPRAMLAALEVLDRLGAEPMARLARRRLRDRGERPPAGPRPTTREHPLGLTARQAEVLGLLATGATNAAIAAQLVVSVRTVDNHVSAILRKLDVSTRAEAVEVARRAAVV